MSELVPISITDMIAEVRRELAMRERLYPGWKRKVGRVKREQIERQMVVMNAVLKHLEEEHRHARSVD